MKVKGHFIFAGVQEMCDDVSVCSTLLHLISNPLSSRPLSKTDVFCFSERNTNLKNIWEK